MGISMRQRGKYEYKGVTVTVLQRVINGKPVDWGYNTSNGIMGVGQADYAAVERDAEHAIDLLEKEDAEKPV